jgi:hypothetical protein
MPEEDQEEVTLTRGELEALKKGQADARQSRLELYAFKAGIDMDSPTAKLVFKHELPDDFTEETIKQLAETHGLFPKKESAETQIDPNEKVGEISGEEERIALRQKGTPDEPPPKPDKTSHEIASEVWNASIIDKGVTESLAEVLHNVMIHDAEIENKQQANQAYYERQQRREEQVS